MPSAHSFKVGGVPYELLPPVPPTHANPHPKYAAIYRGQQTTGGNLVSVNAGDSGLYVGGGTINLAFSGQIADPNAYQAIHGAAQTQARKGTSVITGYTATDPVVLVDVLLSATDDGSSTSGAAETVFLDIFTSGTAPHQNPTNYAMLYLVPPFGPGYSSDQEFLDAVKRSAVNIINVVAHYNSKVVPAHASLNLATVSVLRTCLYSSGGYKRTGVQGSDVAKALYTGFASALTAAGKAAGIDLVQFENGDHEFDSIP